MLNGSWGSLIIIRISPNNGYPNHSARSGSNVMCPLTKWQENQLLIRKPTMSISFIFEKDNKNIKHV